MARFMSLVHHTQFNTTKKAQIASKELNSRMSSPHCARLLSREAKHNGAKSTRVSVNARRVAKAQNKYAAVLSNPSL